MIFHLLQRETKTIAGGAILIGALSLASRLVGLLRDRLFASTFGAGDTLDVYYAAFRIPDTVFALLVMGALSASFIPIFMKYYSGGSLDELGAWKFTNRILWLIAGGYVVLAVLGMAFSEPLASLIAPGFGAFKQSHVAAFMRVMFLAQFFLAISTVFGSVLQATKRFLIFSLAPVFYNVGIILGALFFTDSLGPIGLAWGVVLGAVLHLGASAYGMRDLGYRFERPKKLFDPDTQKALSLMGPRVLGLGVAQIQFVILSIIASSLAVGSVAGFQLAFNLQFFPVGILGVSYAIAVFPVLSEYAHAENLEAFRNAFASAMRQLLYLVIPATILFLLLRAQIVRVVLGGGGFGWDETILVADTLAFFSLSFFAQSMNYLLVRGLFAFKDSVTPLVVGVISAMVMVLAAFSFSKSYGVVGLAMAFSLTSIIQTALLWVILLLRVGSLGESQILPGLFRMTVAGIGMGLAVQFAKPFTLSILSLETFWGVFLQGLFAGLIGLVAYVGLTYALKTEELQIIREGFDRKFLRRFRPTETTGEV